MKPVLVLSGHVISLGIVRALGEASIPVYVASYGDVDVAQASRYVIGSYRVPAPSDVEAFVGRLVEIGRTLDRPLLVPGDDASLIALSLHRAVLEEWYVLACPPAEVVSRLIDKTVTYQLAGAAGVPVPRTIAVRSAREAGDAADQIGYPCILKPTESHFYYDHFGVKFRHAGRRSEAEAACVEGEQAGVHMMVQEFVAGDDRLALNYNAYALEGEALVEFTARKVRMSPPGEGVPSVVLSVHVPEILDLGRRTLRALGLSGFACTEFKWNERTGRYVLFEVNGRYNRSNLLATRCGINFPLIEYRHRLLGVVPGPASGQKQIWWIDEFKDLASFPSRVRLDPRNALTFWRPYLGRRVGAMFDWRDPQPFLFRIRLALRSLGRKLIGRSEKRAPVIRRRRWRLGIALVLVVGGLAYVRFIEGFLAVTQPVFGEVLVVESWFPENRALDDAAVAFRRGHYRRVVCVALEKPSERASGKLPGADRAARRLIALGVDAGKVRVLNLPYVNDDRTFDTALATREFLKRELPETHSVDVFTIGVHARKSHVLFRKAFPPEVAVGIIAGDDRAYPFSQWWLSRRGIYVTVRNTIGYLYALTFSPPPLAGGVTNPP